MAENILSDIDLDELSKLIKESEDPTARGREKRKMSVENIKLYDWERMSESEKKEAAASVGIPIEELDNRLREKSVEARMEFNIEGDEGATAKIQKSAQAMMDAYGGNMSKEGFDRDVKLFEKAYGAEMADKLVTQLRPKVDPLPKSGTSTTMGGELIPSAKEIEQLSKESDKKKAQAFLDALEKERLALEENRLVEEFIEGNLPTSGSSTTEEGGEWVDPFPMGFVEEDVDPFGAESLIMGSEGSGETIVPSETIRKGDPLTGDPIDVYTEPMVLSEEDRLVEEFIEGNLPEPEKEKEKEKEKTKVGKFLQSLFKKKNKKNNKNVPSDVEKEDFDPVNIKEKYYATGGMIKPFMQYLMGGKAPKYDDGGRTLSVPQVYAQEVTQVPPATPAEPAPQGVIEPSQTDSLSVEDFMGLGENIGSSIGILTELFATQKISKGAIEELIMNMNKQGFSKEETGGVLNIISKPRRGGFDPTLKGK